MKLNEKALKKIQDEMEHGEYQIPCGYENVEGMSIYHLEEHEFEPDDFQGCVVMTIREAKLLLEFAYGRCPDCDLYELDIFENIEKRIKQVEMSKQST